ncbi:MAG: hypothetical protein ACRDH6_10070 [Actinomycetota bacterium]
MLVIGMVLALLVLFELSAVALGTDTRDGDDWRVHRRRAQGA